MSDSGQRLGGAEILLIDDDPIIVDVMTERLRAAGHRVHHAWNAAEARARVHARHPDLIVLDLILPDADGLTLCASLRQVTDVPVIIVSGTQRKRDTVLGLRLGADDFITKPFDLEEFEARIGAVLRRYLHQPESVEGARSSASGFTLDRARQAIRVGDANVSLTSSEYRILDVLACHTNNLVTHEQLAEAVWGKPTTATGRALDTHIRRLRHKLASIADMPMVVSVHGQGYKLVLRSSAEKTASAKESPRSG